MSLAKDQSFYDLYDSLSRGISDYSCSDFINKAQMLFPKIEEIKNILNNELSQFWKDPVQVETETKTEGPIFSTTILNAKSFVEDVVSPLVSNNHVEDLKNKLKLYIDAYDLYYKQYKNVKIDDEEFERNKPPIPLAKDYEGGINNEAYKEAYETYKEYVADFQKIYDAVTKSENFVRKKHSECEDLITKINGILNKSSEAPAASLDGVTAASPYASAPSSSEFDDYTSKEYEEIDEKGNTHKYIVWTDGNGVERVKDERIYDENGEEIESYQTWRYANGNVSSYITSQKNVTIDGNEYENLTTEVRYYEDETVEKKYTSYDSRKDSKGCKYLEYENSESYSEDGSLTSVTEKLKQKTDKNNKTIISEYKRVYDSNTNQEKIECKEINTNKAYDSISSISELLEDEGCGDVYNHNKYKEFSASYKYSDEENPKNTCFNRSFDKPDSDDSYTKPVEEVIIEIGECYNSADNKNYYGYKYSEKAFKDEIVEHKIEYARDGNWEVNNFKQTTYKNINDESIEDSYISYRDGKTNKVLTTEIHDNSEHTSKTKYIDGVISESRVSNIPGENEEHVYTNQFYENGKISRVEFATASTELQGRAEGTSYYKNGTIDHEEYDIYGKEGDDAQKTNVVINYLNGEKTNETRTYTDNKGTAIKDYTNCKTGTKTTTQNYKNGDVYTESNTSTGDNQSKTEYKWTRKNGEIETGTSHKNGNTELKHTDIVDVDGKKTTSDVVNVAGTKYYRSKNVSETTDEKTGITTKTTKISGNSIELWGERNNRELVETCAPDGKVLSSVETVKGEGRSLTVDYTYDGDKLVSKSGIDSKTGAKTDVTYTYDGDKVVNEVETIDKGRWSYKYDATYKYDGDKVTSRTVVRTTESEDFGDKVQNFVMGGNDVTVTTSTYKYDSNNRIISEHIETRDSDSVLGIGFDTGKHSIDVEYIYEDDKLVAKKMGDCVMYVDEDGNHINDLANRTYSGYSENYSSGSKYDHWIENNEVMLYD